MTTSRTLARRPGGRPREQAGTVSELGLEAGEEMRREDVGPGHTEQGRARPAGRVTHFCRVEFV